MKLRTLTTRGVAALNPSDTRYTAWIADKPGLAVRVTPNGVKTFVYCYAYTEKQEGDTRGKGKFRWMTLGKFPLVSCKAALEAYGDAAATRAKGKDPVSARKLERERLREELARREAERRAAAARESVAELAKIYLDRWAKPRKRSWREDERLLRQNVLPSLGHKKARDITKRDVIALLDDLQARGLGVGTNRVFSVLRRMFYFAMERDLLDASPCVAVKAPVKERQRDRRLNNAEVCAFFAALDDPTCRMAPQIRLALKLALATGQRVGEIAGAQWSEFDLEARQWTIPRERMKSGHSHSIPLNNLAMKLLREARLVAGTSPCVLPSTRGTRRPVRVSSIGHALRRNWPVFQQQGILEEFRVHDLRRTAATIMGDEGASRFIIDRLQDHADRSIGAIYDRAERPGERQKAMDQLGAALERLIARGWGKRAAQGVAG